ncbi:hypothetical protein ACHWQZ_G018480 [Mnemiopsis leidyi]
MTHKIVALVSGGKDSTYTIHQCVRAGHDIVALAHLHPPPQQDELDSYMYQTVGHNVVGCLSKTLGVRLFAREISGLPIAQELGYKKTENDEVEDLYELLREVKETTACTAVCSGAIFSTYQKNRVEEVCSRLGLVSIAPLWEREQETLLQEMIDNHLQIRIIKVASIGLDKSHVGKQAAELLSHFKEVSMFEKEPIPSKTSSPDVPHCSTSSNIKRETEERSETSTGFTCPRCQAHFSEVETFVDHVREHHKELNSMQSDDQSDNLTNSKHEKDSEKLYKCEICPKSFADLFNLIIHKRTHSGEKAYKCDVCFKTFGTKYVLTKHERTHTGERPYKCDICFRSFTQKPHLTSHRRIHTGEKPYKCGSCSKSFATKFGMVTHERSSHVGQDPVKCDMCFKSLASKHTLTRHKKSHIQEKFFKCGVCPKSFGARDTLKKHERTHTGEKPYTCEICLRSFAQRPHLTSHKRTHTGEKPFKCGICSKSFIQKSGLTTHEKTHSNKKQYKHGQKQRDNHRQQNDDQQQQYEHEEHQLDNEQPQHDNEQKQDDDEQQLDNGEEQQYDSEPQQCDYEAIARCLVDLIKSEIT